MDINLFIKERRKENGKVRVWKTNKVEYWKENLLIKIIFIAQLHTYTIIE